MLKEMNNKSLAWGIPGLLIQIAGNFIHPLWVLVGTILLIIGLAYYSKAKGYSMWLGLFGLLSFIGLIVLIALKDRKLSAEEIEAKKETKGKDVILGIMAGLGILIGVPLIIVLIGMLFMK